MIGAHLKYRHHSLWIYTMNRCISWAAAALLALSLHATASAQVIVRDAPKDVKPAILHVVTPQDVKINDKMERFSPGARVRDLNNMLVLPGSLVGKSVYTVYKREGMTNYVHEVWLLTEDEYKRLGGADAGTPDGYKRFAELLNLIFAARAMGLGR
jgi:hypothetical protein